MSTDQLRERCQAWNQNRDHQVMAGKARSATMTYEERVAAGNASFLAFSVRMRAGSGIRQLFPQAAAKYVAPDEIGLLGVTLPLPLQQVIHLAWSHGLPYGADYWVPSEYQGRHDLGSVGDVVGHVWCEQAVGWHWCTECFLVAYCPGCICNTATVYARLPLLRCEGHA